MSELHYHLVADLLGSTPAPYNGLIVDVVEYPRNTFAYRIYLENLREFSDDKQLALAEWIKGRLEMAQHLGGGLRVGFEVEEYLPGKRNE